MTARKRPLRGRVVLVVGAGDDSARTLALHLAARGAGVVVAGPALADLVVTAGRVAAQGDPVRVVEEPSPPLLGADLVRAAAKAYDVPTDVLVSVSAFASKPEAEHAARDLAAALPPGAVAQVLDCGPERSPRGAIDGVLARFLASGSEAGPSAASAPRA